MQRGLRQRVEGSSRLPATIQASSKATAIWCEAVGTVLLGNFGDVGRSCVVDMISYAEGGVIILSFIILINHISSWKEFVKQSLPLVISACKLPSAWELFSPVS